MARSGFVVPPSSLSHSLASYFPPLRGLLSRGVLRYTTGILTLAVMGACSSSVAQGTGAVLGQPTLQKYINVGGGVDEINTGDLTVHVSIPLASKGSYGPPVSTSLDMDSRSYMYNYNTGSGNQIFTNGGFVFRSSARWSVSFPSFNIGSGTCTTAPYPELSAWPIYDGSGTFHPALAGVVGCGSALYPPGSNGDGWALGVGLSIDPPNVQFYGLAISPSGLYSGIASPPLENVPCIPHSVADLHTNTISDNLCWTGSSSAVTQASGSIFDAAGNAVLTASLNQSNVILQYPGPNSTTPEYKLTFTTYTINQDFGCGLTVPAAYTTYLLTGLGYPDGSAASFTYESNSLHAGTITGRIASITLPTGATIGYSYTGGTNGVNCADGTTSGITKVTPDGSWTLTHTAGSGSTNLSTTTVVAPSGDYSIDTLVAIPPNPQTPFVIPQTSTVATLSYNSAGKLMASKYFCYSGNHPTSPLSCANPPAAPGFAPSEIDTWTYVPGVTSPSLEAKLLDPYMRVTDVKTYGFGGTVGGTNYDTDVQTAYGSWNGSACTNITNTLAPFGEYILMDRVCYNKTFISGNTTPVSTSYYTYGTSGNSFGELVTEQQTIGGNLVTVDSRTYDNLGRVLSSVGPNGEATTSAYADCSGQQLSSAAARTNNLGATLTVSYSGYDCVGEKATITTDANLNQSSVNYGTDPFWRPMSTTDAAGNLTQYTYTPASGSNPATVDVQRTIVSGSSSEETLTQFDSMGRTKLVQVRQGPSSSQYTITETDYDSDGRVNRVTLPYSGSAGTTNSTINSTKTTYDGLGRTLTVTGPAYNGTTPGSKLTYSYNANDVLVTESPAPTGENTKARQTERNGLGEVTSVCEVTTMAGSSSCGQSTSATGFLTTYNYYPGGKLQTVTQYANGSTQQVRSFTYDNNNTGRPLTATTPESGTSTTIYDSDPSGLCASFVGLAVKTIDNAGGMACFHYDLADRVVSETFLGPNSEVTAPKSFIYDASSNPQLSCTKTNAAGKLVEVATAKVGTASVTIGGTEQVTEGTYSTGGVSVDLSQGNTYGNIAVFVVVNGNTVGSTYSTSGESGTDITSALATQINGNSGSPVNATSTPPGTGYGGLGLTSKTVGANANYPYSVSCSNTLGGCSYVIAAGSTMTGGTNGGDYDTGSVWITLNGVQTAVSYGQNSTPATVATALVSAINGNTSLPFTATLSGSTVELALKTGSTVDYPVSVGSSSSQPTVFSNPSFTATTGFGPFASDELFCYDPDGRKTDTFLWTSNGYNAYGHISEAYYPNGVPSGISWAATSWPTPTPPTISYTPDAMGRPYSASDSNGNTLVSSTSYYLNNGVNKVIFGNGDKSVYTEYTNFAPNTSTHTIGTTANNTIAYTTNWNSNGTVKSLQTVDSFNSVNSQTCTFSYDDLVRISTDNCGTPWNESTTYDPFGNITKSGSSPWPPLGVTYNSSTNQYYKASSNPFVYDANGRLLNDTFDTLAWDVNGNLVSQTGTTFQYDAFDRPLSSTSAGVLTSYVYAPDGALLATLSGSSPAFTELFIALPASRAVYTGSTLSLNHLDRYDWQNTVRVSSTWGRTLYDDVSYDAFGMPYWNSGTDTNLFAGLTGDISSGTELVSESRRYHASQGRWESPDDRIPDLYDPQSFNAYGYVNNLPTSMTDPSGYEPFLTDPNTGVITVDLNGMTVYDVNGNTIPLEDISQGLYNTTYISCPSDSCVASPPPITSTDPQEPVYYPTSDIAMTSFGVPPPYYPSQHSAAQNAQFDQLQTGISMVTAIGGGFVGGLGGGLASVSGPGLEIPQLTTVGPVSTVDACLAGCLSRAIQRLNIEGLTPEQSLAVAKDPTAFARMAGSQLDGLFKAELESAISTGEIPNSIQVTPRFKFGPDVYDTESGKWWDVTTPGQWNKHVTKYTPGYGSGSPLFYNRTNLFLNPLPNP